MAKRIVCWLAAAVLLFMGTMAGALADTPREIYPWITIPCRSHAQASTII